VRRLVSIYMWYCNCAAECAEHCSETVEPQPLNLVLLYIIFRPSYILLSVLSLSVPERNWRNFSRSKSPSPFKRCTVSQETGRRFPAAATRIRPQVTSYGICDAQLGITVRSSRILASSLPVIVPATASRPSIMFIPRWHNFGRCNGFHSRRYQIFWVAVGLERDPLSPCESKWGATGKKSSVSGLENWD
jgi:hypothetical protein